MIIKQINKEKTYIVRHPVLRPGKPISSCIMPGDELASTIHLGAFVEDNIVGVCTLMVNNHEALPLTQAIQLRGMAVLDGYKGLGIGKKLLTFGEELVQDRFDVMWMNARIVAVPFYEKLQYQIIGNVFDIPGIGDHYTMYKKLK